MSHLFKSERFAAIGVNPLLRRAARHPDSWKTVVVNLREMTTVIESLMDEEPGSLKRAERFLEKIREENGEENHGREEEIIYRRRNVG